MASSGDDRAREIRSGFLIDLERYHFLAQFVVTVDWHSMVENSSRRKTQKAPSVVPAFVFDYSGLEFQAVLDGNSSALKLSEGKIL